MTVKEFFESVEQLAIHCDSEKKAIKLLNAFDKAGYRWHSGTKYTDMICWDRYKKDTCYSNEGGYCDKEWYQCCKDYRIIEFEDIKYVEIEQGLLQYTIDELLEEIKRRIKE